MHAFDGKGGELTPTRPDPYEWDVTGHDGTVRVAYKVFGDRVDGTYLGDRHDARAHEHAGDADVGARPRRRPVRVTFVPPRRARLEGGDAAASRPPTRWTFTAPNLQYLMDSPTELSDYTLRSFTVRNPDGTDVHDSDAVHHDGTDAEVDAYAAGVEKIVHEAAAVYGEFPQYETGHLHVPRPTTCPGAAATAWSIATARSSPAPASIAAQSRGVLGTVAHEFFHCWNVERIRPQALEPFDFEDANMSGELWLAEGFTQYYGGLIMTRAGLMPTRSQAVGQFGQLRDAASSTDPGRQFRSAVEMSRMAPFIDAARAVDRTNFSNTFISYYTYGGAIALALDLTLRDRSDGKVTLDDYMRAMWRAYGKPGRPAARARRPAVHAHRRARRLAEVSGDRAFAADFFDRYIAGREVADYARLFARAGVVLRKRNPGRAWLGDVSLARQRVGCPICSARTARLIEAGFD